MLHQPAAQRPSSLFACALLHLDHKFTTTLVDINKHRLLTKGMLYYAGPTLGSTQAGTLAAVPNFIAVLLTGLEPVPWSIFSF